ncbi:hypothetical protein CXF92_18490 [Pseudomonas sp. Choline-3u-10]|uniref:Tail fiber protein n=1 Tax=viral metagenome TaxID=1070528 RepID=A0A6H1ZKR2_9ZZZZ|nr:MULTISPECIES: hypothetical protein [Pseudomonadaceae]MBK3797547.1 hypothetical protein [Stutzerimonas stutzeri]MBK3876386.1 hypothetical protein [Stutzerimonas stutzeri]PKG90907.1 hypothetical protein CXF92_18490 [Pseudomonas sp. Choline-3u-10]|tara:strand:- start:92 stop:1324 length:1233 start_codon:yes stop_codon:yes gene_type:complete
MQRFINNWQAPLLAPLAAGDLTVSVAPIWSDKLGALGSGDYYLVTAYKAGAVEIMRVTAQAGGVLTVERAQEGTDALTLEAGDEISANVTASTLESLRDVGGASSWGSITGTLADQVDLQQALDAKPDGADLAAVATSGAYADLGGKPFIPTDAGDVGAATAAQGAKADTAVQPQALTDGLAAKVDAVPGKQLSDENYTSAEKTKLAGLEAAHYRGTYVNFTALTTALPTAVVGDYADVDAGADSPVLRYIWDASDNEWVAQAGSADPITAAQVKTLYESNADTNAFTDTEKTKLVGVAEGATANTSTDTLAEGATNLYHTAARVRGVVLTGLSLATGTVIAATDTVLSALGKLQAQITALTTTVGNKVDKVAGKQLSTEDYTAGEKQQLADAVASIGDIQSALTTINGE